jgi:hypothetical protein
VRRTFDQIPNEPDSDGLNFPKYTAGKELNYPSFVLDTFRSKYLLDQAVRYHVPAFEHELAFDGVAQALDDIPGQVGDGPVTPPSSMPVKFGLLDR